jgi:hypothetical protein
VSKQLQQTITTQMKNPLSWDEILSERFPATKRSLGHEI